MLELNRIEADGDADEEVIEIEDEPVVETELLRVDEEGDEDEESALEDSDD